MSSNYPLKIDYPEYNTDYLASLRANTEDFKALFNQKIKPVPMSNFYSRIKNIINPDPESREFYELKHTIKSRGISNTKVHIRLVDLQDLMREYESMEEVRRQDYIDYDLRGDPEIRNIPESEEKEFLISNEFRRRNMR